MTERKREVLLLAAVFAVSFCFAGMLLLGSYRWNESLFYERISAAAASCDGAEEIMRALKDPAGCDIGAGRELLRRYGYEGRLPAGQLYPAAAGIGLLFATAVAAAFAWHAAGSRKRLRRRTEELTGYLRQVEEGGYTISLERRQDLFSGLEDEIYKTVLALRESRERLGREKETLAQNLADISHQFKTPLTSIAVLSELLERHAAGSEDAELIRRLAEQIERLTTLTSVLLTLSRADAGAITFDIRNVSVSELTECSLAAVSPLLERRGQRAKVLWDGGTHEVFLSCDPGWMEEALSNLLKNASEHAPEHTDICIRVRDNPVFTEIAVEDAGPGFSRRDLRCLFERFYRGEHAAKDSTGIGLSLAKALIEGQKGELRAENRKGGGARFLIKFYKHV